jgi:hypothetical protein
VKWYWLGFLSWILQFFFVVYDTTNVWGKCNIGNYGFVFGRSLARISVSLPAIFQRLCVLRQSPWADFFIVPFDRLLSVCTINCYVYLPLLFCCIVLVRCFCNFSMSSYISPAFLLLGALAKLRKSTTSFVISVRPHGKIQFLLYEFLWNLIFVYLSIMYREIQVSFESGKNDGYFTGRPCTFMIYLA